MTPKRITILGATGSVGQSTLDLIRRSPDRFQVVGLTANRNVDALARDAVEFGAQAAAVADPDCYGALKAALSGTNVEAMAGPEAVCDLADRPVDYVMAAIVGAAGLRPTLAAVRTGCHVAFANKECLVTAGDLMMREVAAHGATLLPVDSEHNAIFQVFDSSQRQKITRLILTASGGPFRTWTREQMTVATPQQAVSHPNWDMGAKISVDSATMMNKGLELIEAHHLFGFPEDRIDIVVHPQSVIHSMVEYADGSVLAQLGTPDMRTPIANTLAWPDRMESPSEKLDFMKLSRLDFEPPDEDRYPALKLARDALRSRDGAPVVLNAANEVAVAHFLAGRIGFARIAGIVEEMLQSVPELVATDLEAILELDAATRRRAEARLFQAAE